MLMRITVELIETLVDEVFKLVVDGEFDFIDDADLLVVLSDYVEDPNVDITDRWMKNNLRVFLKHMLILYEGTRGYVLSRRESQFSALGRADLERVYQYICAHPLLESVRHICLTTPLHFCCIDGPLCIALIESQKKYPTRTNGK